MTRKQIEALNALANVRDYLRETLGGKLPESIVIDINTVAQQLGVKFPDWCLPE